MSKNNVVKLAGRDTIIDPLTELLRTGAEQLVYQAVEAELLELLADHTNRNADRVLVAIDIANQSHDALILWPSGKKQAVKIAIFR